MYSIISRALWNRIPITPRDAELIFKDWEKIPLHRGVIIVGVVLRKGPEVHIIIDPTHQNHIVFIKKCKDILAATIAKYQYAETKVARNHTVGHRLAEILGFSQVSSDTDVVHYKKV
jgi:hypothetical protein